MIMDQIGHVALYEHMLLMGYTGTLDAWQSEIRKNSYASQIRLFLAYEVGPMGRRYPEMLPWLTRLCASAEGRFDHAHTHTDWNDRCHISFSRGTALDQPGHRLALASLRISFEPCGGKHLAVTIQAYVGSGDRCKQKTLTFAPSKGGHA